MKKLFLYMFAAVALVSCSDSNNGNGEEQDTPPPGVTTTWLGDWNDRYDAAYKPEYDGSYNPVQDEWKVVKKNGKEYTDTLLYKYWEARSWRTATGLKEGKPFFEPNWNGEYKRTAYKINDKQFMFDDGTIFEYSLTVSKTEDKLRVYDGRDTWELVPYTDSWTWKGNWNDPLDRHYAVYQGKYNPLKGTWKLTHEDGEPVGSSLYYYIFDDNYKRGYSQDGVSFSSYRDYKINSSMINVQLTNNTNEFKYHISEDTLFMTYKGTGYFLNEKFIRIK